MAAFPLFQLPLVAMEHVLCMMNPFDLIDLSKTSSKTRTLVKRFFRIKPKFEVCIGYTNEPHIWMVGKHESWGSHWTSNQLRIGYEQERYLSRPLHKIIKYSVNPHEEWMKEYEYVKGLLECRVELVFYLWPFVCNGSLHEEIMNWIKSQPKVHASNFLSF
uniref:F-box domain-containing protein n=1 Tax=Caenorhabditis tropicalis TaxID=1561998 RepID=A0A1I7TH91_9PELO